MVAEAAVLWEVEGVVNPEDLAVVVEAVMVEAAVGVVDAEVVTLSHQPLLSRKIRILM